MADHYSSGSKKKTHFRDIFCVYHYILLLKHLSNHSFNKLVYSTKRPRVPNVRESELADVQRQELPLKTQVRKRIHSSSISFKRKVNLNLNSSDKKITSFRCSYIYSRGTYLTHGKHRSAIMY